MSPVSMALLRLHQIGQCERRICTNGRTFPIVKGKLEAQEQRRWKEVKMKCRNMVGEQVRRLRTEREMSQNDLAVQLQLRRWDIGRSGIARIEAQEIWVGDFQTWVLADFFRVPVPILYPSHEARRRAYEILTDVPVRDFFYDPTRTRNSASPQIILSAYADNHHLR
jgi:transcriptional regulator with XRE-family HTH domain